MQSAFVAEPVHGRPPAADGSTKELAWKAAAGDAESTAALLRSVRPGVVAVVRRILGARADAEDAIQMALMGFVQALPAYRGDCEPVGYAKTIAVRAALAFRRRSADRLDVDCRTSTLPSREPSPSDDLIAERRRTLLRQLLSEIPEEQAEALAMRIVLGWSLQEIASQSSVPFNTVRSRIRLAKEALRRKIEGAPERYASLDMTA